jgi:hypothetical protein
MGCLCPISAFFYNSGLLAGVDSWGFCLDYLVLRPKWLVFFFVMRNIFVRWEFL